MERYYSKDYTDLPKPVVQVNQYELLLEDNEAIDAKRLILTVPASRADVTRMHWLASAVYRQM